ncbi:MAG: hypothetical protein V1916_02475 [Patescibacteria group bacterium]
MVLVSTALTVGMVNAKEIDVTIKQLGGKVGDVFKVAGTVITNALKVKGTAQFSGSISNPTGDVTIADNARIDGRVYRGAQAGTADTQPFIVNDNMEVVGSLRVGSGVAVTGNLTFNGITPLQSKTYAGTIDITQSGDEVVSTAESACPVPTGYKNYSYHYKKVAVAEIDLNNLPDVRVFVKSGAGYPFDMRPNGGDVWSSGSFYLSPGYVYIYYKMGYNICNGTTTPANYTTGEYKIILNY